MALPVVYRRTVGHDLAAAFDYYEQQAAGLGPYYTQLVIRDSGHTE